jgi:hypothetical protein
MRNKAAAMDGVIAVTAPRPAAAAPCRAAPWHRPSLRLQLLDHLPVCTPAQPSEQGSFKISGA